MHRLAAMLLACTALATAGAAHAQGRGAPASKLRDRAAVGGTPEARAARLAELEAWLARLEGRFSFEGTTKLFWGTTDPRATTLDPRAPEDRCEGGICYVNRDAKGVGSCRPVGNGPGLHCAINVPWPRFYWPSVALGAGLSGEMKWRGPYLDGAVALYGIDPDTLGINFLLVDGQSMAYTEPGVLRNDTVTFEASCGGSCRRNFRVIARPDGGLIEMEYELKLKGLVWAAYRFTLRHESGPTDVLEILTPQFEP
jgi:hypothetical protein